MKEICRVKDCKNPVPDGFKYCNNHMCSRLKRNGTRCRNKKWGNSPFCFPHQFTIIRLDILAIIGILLAVLSLFFGPQIYSSVFGKLEIDFKNDVLIKDGVSYAKIEVLNELGYSLLYVNGTATLNCDGLMGPFTSGPFRLEGNYDFLAHGAKSEFLLSPDPFLIDLVKTRDVGCSDVTFQFAKYTMINKTHAHLSMVDSFDAYGENNTVIKKKSYLPNESFSFYPCEKCEILINIYAANVKEPFSKREYQSFAGLVKTRPFQDFMKKPDYINVDVNEFFNSRIFFNPKYGPCENMTGRECATLLCGKIREQNITEIYCDQYGGYQKTISVPIFPLNNPEISSAYP